ncbi:MAG: hypothetical protein ACLPYS_15560 [Vulcanimicrobiaceae bacterium]
MTNSKLLTLAKVVVIVLFLSIPILLLAWGRYQQEARLDRGEQLFWYHEVVSVSDVEMHEGQIADEWLVSGPFATESLCQAELQRDLQKKADPKPGETGDDCLQHFTADAAALTLYKNARPMPGPGDSGM